MLLYLYVFKVTIMLTANFLVFRDSAVADIVKNEVEASVDRRAHKRVSNLIHGDITIDGRECLSTLFRQIFTLPAVSFVIGSCNRWPFWGTMHHVLANRSTGCKAVHCSQKNWVSGQPNAVARQHFVWTNDWYLPHSKIAFLTNRVEGCLYITEYQ